MDSTVRDLTVIDRNTGAGLIELSSQGKSGQDASLGVLNQVTDDRGTA